MPRRLAESPTPAPAEEEVPSVSRVLAGSLALGDWQSC